MAAERWCDEAEEELLADYPAPRLGPVGLGDAGGPVGPFAAARLWWLGVHLAAWRLSRVVDGADKVAGSVLLRRAIRRLVHCRSHGMVVEETRAEADGVTRAGQLPACRPEGQPSIEAVFSAQGVATGGGFSLGGGAYVPPASRRGGRRHQSPRRLHSLAPAGAGLRGFSKPRRRQAGSSWVETWRAEEQHRQERVEAEAARELARLPVSPFLDDDVSLQLRRELAAGKRKREGPSPEWEPRARTGPPPPPLTDLLSRRVGERSLKRARAVDLSGPLPMEAARAAAIRRCNVEGSIAWRSGV